MFVKNFLYKIWNYSPAQIFKILRFEITPPRYLPRFKVLPNELKRLRKMPRYVEGETILMGKKVSFIDVDSYLNMCDEIFKQNNYKFKSSKEIPLIIDCGSNIGLSVIYFKLLYPKAKVIAFEPDKKAFFALEKNIKSFKLKNVLLNNSAVWVKDGKIDFSVEGSWGGKISMNSKDGNIIAVSTTRLNKILEKKVDFLKIDIEGAETAVLKDCAKNLGNVKDLFVEYHSSVDKKQALPKILSIITKAGMRYYIKEASSRKHPFVEKATSGFDLQVNIFAYRGD